MRRRLALLLLLLAASAPAAAQERGTGELTPTLGYRFAGTLRDDVTGESFSIRPSWSWGFVAGLAPWSENLYIEGTYLQQLTRASGDNTFAGGDGNLHDMRLQTALAGVQWDFSPRASLRPFVSAGLGATSLEAQGGGHTTSFTLSLAGGVKVMTSSWFGLRLQGRALAIFSNGGTTDLCHFSDCHVAIPGWGTVQGDLSVGALFAF
jgi:hypothetical protein